MNGAMSHREQLAVVAVGALAVWFLAMAAVGRSFEMPKHLTVMLAVVGLGFMAVAVSVAVSS